MRYLLLHITAVHSLFLRISWWVILFLAYSLTWLWRTRKISSQMAPKTLPKKVHMLFDCCSLLFMFIQGLIPLKRNWRKLIVNCVFHFAVSSVSVEAYERRIKKLEREKSELSWKLQESTKVLQEQSIDTKSGSRSSDSGSLNEELSMAKRKNNGEKWKQTVSPCSVVFLNEGQGDTVFATMNGKNLSWRYTKVIQ